VAADVLAAAAIAAAAGRAGLSPRVAALGGLAWLACPVALLVTELAWVDPVLIAASAVAAWCASHPRWHAPDGTPVAVRVALGTSLGVAAAVKQYGALAGILALAWLAALQRAARLLDQSQGGRSASPQGDRSLSPRLDESPEPNGFELAGADDRRRSAVRSLLAGPVGQVAGIATCTWLALLLPLVLRDPASWYRSTVEVYLNAPPRPDALSLVALAANEAGWKLPGAVLSLMYLAIVALAVAWLSRLREPQPAHWAGACAVAYGAMFLFGKQAFCNYYLLVGFWAWTCALYRLAEDRREVATAGVQCRTFSLVSPALPLATLP
jgi:hypothetical protein